MRVHAASDMRNWESVKRWFGSQRERERRDQEFDDGADDVPSN